ncbi:Pecanex protein-domain-containing protein [Baffinella frigidus]|nr:Pecanex protein-domain-containing protein [Cryptophyta sp. CCMP2293]
MCPITCVFPSSTRAFRRPAKSSPSRAASNASKTAGGSKVSRRDEVDQVLAELQGSSTVQYKDGGAEEIKVKKLLGACYGIVEDWGHVSSSHGPEHVALLFSGDIPSSSQASWLESKGPLLREVIARAYRYAFKFCYDCQVYGTEEDDLFEMRDHFDQYDKEWYLGPESGAGWAEAITEGTSKLMSIKRDKGVTRSRVASSIRQAQFQVGKLNGEAVRGLWSSLAMELYYFSNEDDERYSIQSNTVLLRNLMVQTAAPPLGYPLFQGTFVAHAVD